VTNGGAMVVDRIRPDTRSRLERDAWTVIFGVALVLSLAWVAPFYVGPNVGNVFLDAHVYFRATEAWVAGANPWTTSFRDVPFAAIPPTLLLNLPLLPFGEGAAVSFWAVANSAAVIYMIRRLRLPIWVLLLQPILEGWLAASPDLTLAALLVGGGGWFAALTKPYAAPALIAEGRWRQLVAWLLAFALTVPLLPWPQFVDAHAAIADTFARFANHPVSAAGTPVLMVITAIALVALGWKRGWALFTPGLLAQQPHYNVFVLDTIVRSKILSLALTLPLPHAAAIGVIAYAVHERWIARTHPTVSPHEPVGVMT
jgi:hypothetical protein